MSALLALLAPFWRPIAAVLAGFGAYLKGRADAARKAELKDLKDANEIRRDGAAARADAASGRLRDSDGWRRD